MPSAAIKIFLVHGDPKRLRTAELSNWTGKTVAGPRSEFNSALAREESEKSGIYCCRWRLCGVFVAVSGPAPFCLAFNRYGGRRGSFLQQYEELVETP
jgi:hypothetical protein